MSESAVEGAVLTEARGHTAVISINRPAERNSLSVKTLGELQHSFSSVLLNPDIRAVIITGSRDVFASGADIRELSGLAHDSAEEFALRGQRLFQEISNAPQLTIAAVNGYCMGGGMDLALACDIRFASSDAVFAHPGARLGIITGWGGTQRLPRLIGQARAMEILLTARRVNGDEALETGLVSQVGDPVLELAIKFAEGLG